MGQEHKIMENLIIRMCFKLNLFRIRELLKNCRKCSAFENFDISEYVNIVCSRILPVVGRRYVISHVGKLTEKKLNFFNEVSRMTLSGIIVRRLT
jgi:hypothetical protein